MAPSFKSLLWAFAGAAMLPRAAAENKLLSSSLNPCQENSSFSATLFDVVFTPKNGTFTWDINGVSTINGNVTIGLKVLAYGLNVYESTINPCDQVELRGLCPMREGPINLNANAQIPTSALAAIPGITYTVPDLDAKVQVTFNSTSDTTLSYACVEAELSNGKTVDQKAVAWTLAVISGLALASSAITSGLGHSNTAAHVAANALALFGYFQAQAFMGMVSIELPPIVASWTQNFQWSMGLIGVDFIQDIATWYQRATGGTPSEILSDLATESVQVQKRSLNLAWNVVKRSVDLVRRTNAEGAETDTSSSIIIRGIKRVGFRAGIEPSNIFLTGYIFFIVFIFFVVIGVILFKYICEALVKAGRLKHDQFQDFRNGWTTVLKGIMYRIVLIGFPQMVVLCFWELTQNDSGAEMVLAIFTIFTMIGILAWASAKVIRLARRSIAMHKNPAYILYSDPVSLNKWGFLYVQFKATAYFFVVPVLFYVLLKGLFIAFAQSSPITQAVALVVIEAAFLIAVCVMTPYMDKKTNAFNISICVINFLSAVFLLIFSNVFGQPGIVTGVIGIFFFALNAVFSTVLLIIVLVSSVIAITSKNPDTRYQPMRDDRSSFIKSQSQLTTELDALGATARGEAKHGFTNSKGARIEDDDDSWSGSDHSRPQQAYNEPPRSPYGPPGSDHASNRHMPPTYAAQQRNAAYDYNSRSGSMTSQARNYQAPSRGGGASPSPWQRGAGYDDNRYSGSVDRVVDMYYNRDTSPQPPHRNEKQEPWL